MINNLLIKFSLKSAELEIKEYSQKVVMGNSEQHGMILSHAFLIFAQLVKRLPVAKIVIESKDNIYEKELADLVLQTNSLLKEYANCGDMQNAAGVKLLNETFRCLAHPELTHYGTKIWSYFSKAQKDAKKYLDDLEDSFIKQQNIIMVTKIKEAKAYLLLIPERYKE